ncbi:MAG: proline dehydrogenase family protein [Myxococcales bacterium]|nr:proline dehydrogenase family protein [Myxococcales bacterium]
MARLEDDVKRIGTALFGAMKGEKPGLFSGERWTTEILEWAMKNKAFKTEMFRFVDVFPVLGDSEAVSRHIDEYLLRPGIEAPGVIRLALKGAGIAGFTRRMAADQIAKNLRGMAGRFIAGETAEGALPVLLSLRRAGQAYSVDLLGEAVVGNGEAATYERRVLGTLETLADAARRYDPNPLLDTDDAGAIPRVDLSVKLTALDSQLNAVGMARSVASASAALTRVFRHAEACGASVNVDMEHAATQHVIIAAFQAAALAVPNARVGIAMQAYLRSAERDIAELCRWAKDQRRRIQVRLVKGAYWDSETALADREGWPSPVFAHKAETDLAFEACLETLIGAGPWVKTAVGSHNVRSIAVALAHAEKARRPPGALEFQSLYGMAEPIRTALVASGKRVRVYAPIGELIPGMAYLVRRLLENTSNASWLRLGFVEGRPMAELLAPPSPPAKPREPPPPHAGFVNEPLRDLSLPAERAAIEHALKRLPPLEATPIIAGKGERGDAPAPRLSPNDLRTVVGTVQYASLEQTSRAIAVAASACDRLALIPVATRAEWLRGLARAMGERRAELTALIAVEVGKPWASADADVAEAIDFCRFYADDALRLFAANGVPGRTVFGETNRLFFLPRGVAAVIAPWNFPLAILTGMAVAALVTGNPVILKPAEQSSLVAARLVQLALAAGIPGDVFQLLPGLGEVVGQRLVEAPEVMTIAFTGSLAVGLAISEAAARPRPGQRGLKRVICEMGGKNAIIVDDDADLDDAILGVIESAFGFAGQKCSACSRVYVIGPRYELFCERLADAAQSLIVGSSLDPATRVGPVVDAESQQRLLGVIDAASGRARRLTPLPSLAPGAFVPPTVFADVPEGDSLLTNELFGPVVAVTRAASLEEALARVAESPYALTGGLFSRTPSHIALAMTHFRAGNLYINRATTGAMVGRQPFGGYGLSGGGTKAGGEGYLRHFVDMRVVTENTMRHGFTPELG